MDSAYPQPDPLPVRLPVGYPFKKYLRNLKKNVGTRGYPRTREYLKQIYIIIIIIIIIFK